MSLIINLLFAVVIAIYAFKIYSDRNLKTVRHPILPNTACFLNRDLHFLIFCIATAMIFLGPLSLVKYGFWIVFMLYLVFTRFHLKIDAIVVCYILFLAWALFSLTYSSVKFQGFMLIIKYSLPLLYLWLGYNAIQDTADFVFLLKKIVWIMVIYAFLIGGFSAKVFPWLYGGLCFKSGGLFISYASLADFYSALFVVPLALYAIFREKKWLVAAGWIALSTVLEVVRTGLGGIFLASSFFLFFYYKLKAVPWLLGLATLAVSIVFFVPAVHEKMFLDDSQTISSISASTMDFDNIQSNGREQIWEDNMYRFFTPNPLTGAGLGESMEYTKNNFTVKLIHNDYVQILCDMGLVGIGLFGLFFLVTILKVMIRTWRYTSSGLVKLSGAMALGSCAGTFFSMAFDNVISYTQQCFVIPFVFIGIFLKAIDMQVQNDNNKFKSV